jgi:hypothetical protein
VSRSIALRLDVLEPGVDCSSKERDMLNIILGILFIIGGLSGKLVFIGTNSGVLLAVVGFILVIWGAYRMYQRNRA